MIRPFRKSDQSRLWELFKLNTPDYFALSELHDLQEYLKLHSKTYYVIESELAVVGAGGYYITEKSEVARIAWDFLDPSARGTGKGRQLVEFRLNKVSQIPTIRSVEVWTSQLAYGFYEKFGFEVLQKENDFWAHGLHLYQMTMSMEH